MVPAIEIDREEDGRWLAEIPDLPGVIVYGPSREEAINKVKALALQVIAERIENSEPNHLNILNFHRLWRRR